MAVLEQEDMTAEEVALRADDIYLRRFKTKLEPEHNGEYLALDVLSEEYELGTNKQAIVERLLGRLPNRRRIFVIRIGFEAAAEVGALAK